ALILSFSTLLSRFLGVLRDWLLADKFGAGELLDIYFTAFRIPDFVYNILIAGGVVVAFLPIFSEYYARDKEKAFKFASNLINIFFVSLSFISLILFFISPELIKFIAPGFSLEAQTQCVILTRVMLLSPILLGLSSVFSGMLQYFNKFLIFSFCPLFYNLGIILGIFLLSPKFGILGVCFGVVLGAFLHLIIQVPSAMESGFKFSFGIDFKAEGLKDVFRLMIPRIFGIASQQINLIVIGAIASTLVEGSVSIFNFSNNLRYLPIGIIGVSFAVSAFPKFTQLEAEKKRKEFLKSFWSVFNKILYLVLPASLLIFIFKDLIVDIVLTHGQFSNSSSVLTSASLGLFCLSIPASALISLLLRGFFALKDTKTPTAIAFFMVILNIALSFWFVSNPPSIIYYFVLREMKGVEVLGLPLAFSVSSIFQFCLLLIFFLKKNEEY
ncbi:MAG: murein biosynthesis integral membrane protein MurJ, partial [Patescibacteria group bacterium]